MAWGSGMNSGELAMLQALLGGRRGSINTLRPSYDDERQRDPILSMGREMMASRPQGDDIGSAISSAVEKLAGAYLTGKKEKQFREKEAKLGADWEKLSPRAWGATVVPATGAQLERAKAAQADPRAFAGPTRGGQTLEQEMLAQGKTQEQPALTMAELASMEGVDPRIKDQLSSVIMAREGQEKMEAKEQQRYDEARAFEREKFEENVRQHQEQVALQRANLAISRAAAMRKAEGEGMKPASFSDVNALGKRFEQESKDYTTIADSLGRVLAGAKSGSSAGDISTVFGFMKALDPSSVVREGEFATAEQVGGPAQRYVNLYNRLLTGERLTPKQRREFVSMAGDLFKASQESQRPKVEYFSNVARKFGMDPDLVTRDVYQHLPAQFEEYMSKPIEEGKPTPSGGPTIPGVGTTGPSILPPSERKRLKFNPQTGELE